jgi:hypothetical protein
MAIKGDRRPQDPTFLSFSSFSSLPFSLAWSHFPPRELWSRHRRFKLIPSSASFFEKIHRTVNVFRQMLAEVENEAAHVDGELQPYEISS